MPLMWKDQQCGLSKHEMNLDFHQHDFWIIVESIIRDILFVLRTESSMGFLAWVYANIYLLFE